MLSTVHAGGEQGWKSGHLEPLLFLSPPEAPVTSPIVLPDWKHSLATADGIGGVGMTAGESACGDSQPPAADRS